MKRPDYSKWAGRKVRVYWTNAAPEITRVMKHIVDNDGTGRIILRNGMSVPASMCRLIRDKPKPREFWMVKSGDYAELFSNKSKALEKCYRNHSDYFEVIGVREIVE
jgi:hypothetical protein